MCCIMHLMGRKPKFTGSVPPDHVQVMRHAPGAAAPDKPVERGYVRMEGGHDDSG